MTVMVVDCVEGLISQLIYLVIAVALVCMFSWGQISCRPWRTCRPANRCSNPFDAFATRDFQRLVRGDVLRPERLWHDGLAVAGTRSTPRPRTPARNRAWAAILGQWRLFQCARSWCCCWRSAP